MPHDDEDEPRERTGRVRRITVDDAENCAWHDRLVEHFGADGRGGEWGRTMKTIDKHELQLEEWKAFRWKLLGMTTIGGLVAGVIAWLVPYLGKH